MQCERYEVIKLAFEEIMSRSYQAVVGTGCSTTTKAISAMLRFWSIPLVITFLAIFKSGPAS